MSLSAELVMPPISGLTLADFDRDQRDAGCCSCLGFLMKDKELDSFLGDRFYVDEGDYGGYLCEDQRWTSGFPSVDRVICRDVPVKLTSHLTMSEVDGKKMVNEYARECNIGRGSYGKVVLYKKKTDGKEYAIKAFYKSRLSKIRVTSSETAWTDVRREVSIMTALEHPNIINLVEVIDDPSSDRFFMVLEYVEGKGICDASGQSGGIGEELSRRWLHDIISGLNYLHAHGVVHGDIKPENILITKGGAAKIGDFSISHAFEDDNDLLWRSPGTPVFTAPECCIGFNYHGKTADVWAVGVTLHCMILGYCPFVGESLQETYDKIVNCPLQISEDLDPDLEELLRGLLCKDPRERMTLESAAQHPWMTREAGLIPLQLSFKCQCGRSWERREDAGNNEDNSSPA